MGSMSLLVQQDACNASVSNSIILHVLIRMPASGE